MNFLSGCLRRIEVLFFLTCLLMLATVIYFIRDRGLVWNRSLLVISGGDVNATINATEEARNLTELWEEKESWRNINILCVVHTCAKNLEKRAQYVKQTWSKLCNKTLYVSDETNETFPTITVTNRTGWGETWVKTRKGIELLYSEYLDKFDWFFKADDDTYVVMDNLRRFLHTKDTWKSEFYGSVMVLPAVKNGFPSGGSGYAWGKESLKRLVEIGFKQGKCANENFATHKDDVYLGLCLVQSGITLSRDCVDSKGRELFHPQSLKNEFMLRWNKASGYYRVSINKLGIEKCCSNESITFHYIIGRELLYMDYLWREFKQN